MAYFSRHITRNFDANKTHRIRYDKDDFTCQIFSFDKTQEQQYSAFKGGGFDYPNGVIKNWRGMKVIKSKNKDRLILKFKYDAKQTSDNYRLEFLFANTYLTPTEKKKNTSLKSNAEIYIDGVRQDSSKGSYWNSNDVNFNRHHQYVHLDKGTREIEYRLVSNSVFIGLSIKKFDIYEAKRHNNKDDILTMIKATVEHSNEFGINTMSAEFMYHHELDEKLLPTDPNANRSGLVFDYRDEINLTVTDTEGVPQRVFGGFISTAEVDDDLTRITLECADRLIDLDRRYNLSEVNLKEKITEEGINYDYGVDYLKDYNYYSGALKYLLKSTELPLKTNVTLHDPLVARNNWRLATYKKGATEKLTTENASATVNKKSMTLRNGADTLKGQKVVIYNNKSRNVCLNDYPNLYFTYGMGTQLWTEVYETTDSVTVESATSEKNKTWLARANSITKATGDACIKPIWKYVAVNFPHEYKKGFYQSAEKTWNRGRGNCCCKTEVMLNLLSAKGITDLKYMHSHNSRGGHIFAKVNGFYVDPSTQIESRGWHHYISKYGKPYESSNYPKKPI